MANIYKSAKGKSLDMDKIKLSNESTVAVSNMKVNARGDALGPGGQVVTGRNAVMDRVYAVESAPEPPYSPNDPDLIAEQQAIQNASNTKKLHDIANNLVTPSDTLETATDAPVARGALASSVAKTVSVVQEPLPDPKTIRRQEGPKRI